MLMERKTNSQCLQRGYEDISIAAIVIFKRDQGLRCVDKVIVLNWEVWTRECYSRSLQWEGSFMYSKQLHQDRLVSNMTRVK